MRIIAYKNGEVKGYVRSVNHKYERFSVIQDIRKAKTYRTQAEVMDEIDTLTRYASMQGYVFIMG